jgi:hypothetical protein
MSDPRLPARAGLGSAHTIKIATKADVKMLFLNFIDFSPALQPALN